MIILIYLQMLNLPGSLVVKTGSNPPEAYFGGDRGLPVRSSHQAIQGDGVNLSDGHLLEGMRSNRL